MVELVGHKLKTHHPVIEPVSDSESGTEFFDAETRVQIRLFVLQRLTRRQGRTRKSPLFTGQMRVSPGEFDT